MNKDIIELFLSGYKYDFKDTNDFNYKFNSRYSEKYFFSEFNKFTSFLDNFFYPEDHYVTSINSCEFILPDRYIKHLIKLYQYTNNNDKLKYHHYLLSDFIFSYFKTLSFNKSKDDKYYISLNKLKKTLESYNGRNFHKKFIDELQIFYIYSIQYAIDNHIYISPETLLRILHNLEGTSCIQEVVDILVNDNKYYLYIYKHDKKVDIHKKLYFDFILKILDQPFCTRNYNKLLNFMLSRELIIQKEKKKLINLFVDKTNRISNKYSCKNESFINAISEIESLKNEISDIISSSYIEEIYKDKLRECVTCILSLKRYLISDIEYMNKDMHETKFETTIESSKVDKFKKEIKGNILRLYSATTEDFDKCVIDSVNYYSKYALQSIASNFSINAKSRTYMTNNDFSSSVLTSFEQYYENVGLEYAKKNSNILINIKSSGYYNEMLKELSRSFNIHQNIIKSLLDDNDYNEIREKINTGFDISIDNDYIRIVYCILYIEVSINMLLERNGFDRDISYKSNIDKLFEIYKDDNIKRNGLMYIYYTLYEHTGPNIRNNASHGMLFGTDLRIPLILTFSGTIFMGWLLNDKS